MVTQVLSWKDVAVIAFGGFGAVARIGGAPSGAAVARMNEMPARLLDALMASEARPDWVTREMLIHGATAEMRLSPAPARDSAPAPETLAAE